MLEKMYLVVATADSMDWYVAVYAKEKDAEAHAKLAARSAFELALKHKGRLKEIELGMNPFDPDMYSERTVVNYYTVEVPIGTIQVRSCESFESGDAGRVSQEGGVGQGVAVGGEGSAVADGVRSSGTQGIRGLLPERAISLEGGRGVSVVLEPVRTDSDEEGEGGTRVTTLYVLEVGGDC